METLPPDSGLLGTRNASQYGLGILLAHEEADWLVCPYFESSNSLMQQS